MGKDEKTLSLERRQERAELAAGERLLVAEVERDDETDVGAQLYAVCFSRAFDEHEFWRLYALADADDYVSDFGKGPIHGMVIRRDRPDLVSALLKKGKPHQIDALMLCAVHNRIESARVLIKAGADRDVSIQDMARSAATIARARGHDEILDMMRGQLDAARTRRGGKSSKEGKKVTISRRCPCETQVSSDFEQFSRHLTNYSHNFGEFQPKRSRNFSRFPEFQP